MVESSALLMRYPDKTGSWVRIPPSPQRLFRWTFCVYRKNLSELGIELGRGSGKREFPRGGAHEPMGSWERVNTSDVRFPTLSAD